MSYFVCNFFTIYLFSTRTKENRISSSHLHSYEKKRFSESTVACLTKRSQDDIFTFFNFFNFSSGFFGVTNLWKILI